MANRRSDREVKAHREEMEEAQARVFQISSKDSTGNPRNVQSRFRSCLFPEEDWGRSQMALEASETFAKKEAVKRHNSEVEHLRTAMTLASGALVEKAEA